MTDDVFDLDALIAEAEGEPFLFTFGGEKYELPPRVDMLALIALDEGRLGDGLRLLFGEDQWQQIEDSDAVFNDQAMEALLQRYFAHLGVELGKSGASSRSSGSTGGRSKRPSKRTIR